MQNNNKKNKRNSAGLRPASGRPEAGSEIHIVMALGLAGQNCSSELHIVRSSFGIPFLIKPLHLPKFL